MTETCDYLELRCRAEDLAVEEGLTQEEIAKALSVGLSTVKRWSVEDGWKQKRKDRVEQRRALKKKLTDLREAMLQQAISSKNPQDVFAAIRLEMLVQKEKKESSPSTADIDRPRIFLEDMEFIADVLKETDPEGLKVFGRNFDTIVSRFKERHEKTAQTH